jgi:hypothetical protein
LKGSKAKALMTHKFSRPLHVEIEIFNPQAARLLKSMLTFIVLFIVPNQIVSIVMMTGMCLLSAVGGMYADAI